jgi:hypothetical protein
VADAATSARDPSDWWPIGKGPVGTFLNLPAARTLRAWIRFVARHSPHAHPARQSELAARRGMLLIVIVGLLLAGAMVLATSMASL